MYKAKAKCAINDPYHERPQINQISDVNGREPNCVCASLDALSMTHKSQRQLKYENFI